MAPLSWLHRIANSWFGKDRVRFNFPLRARAASTRWRVSATCAYQAAPRRLPSTFPNPALGSAL